MNDGQDKFIKSFALAVLTVSVVLSMSLLVLFVVAVAKFVL